MSVPYQAHSETSRLAAEQVNEAAQLEDVLTAIIKAGEEGRTCDEVTAILEKTERWQNIHSGTVAARMKKLKDTEQIFQKSFTRETRSHRQAEVWVHSKFATEEEIEATRKRPKSKRDVIRVELQTVYNFMNALHKGKQIVEDQIKDQIFAKRLPDMIQTLGHVIQELER